MLLLLTQYNKHHVDSTQHSTRHLHSPRPPSNLGRVPCAPVDGSVAIVRREPHRPPSSRSSQPRKLNNRVPLPIWSVASNRRPDLSRASHIHRQRFDPSVSQYREPLAWEDVKAALDGYVRTNKLAGVMTKAGNIFPGWRERKAASLRLVDESWAHASGVSC